MIHFQAGIPSIDVNENMVDTTSLQLSMESIASDGLSHWVASDTIYKGGVYQLQDNVLFWLIADTEVSQATTNFNAFVANFTFSVAPYAHNWTIN